MPAPSDPAAPRTVRVVVPCPRGSAESHQQQRCAACADPLTGQPTGIAVQYATLRDPAAEALMADGERWRNLRDRYTAAEARAMFAAPETTTAGDAGIAMAEEERAAEGRAALSLTQAIGRTARDRADLAPAPGQRGDG